MAKGRAFTALTVLTIGLYGCDCIQIAKGKVLDATTKEPIDSVNVFKKISTEQITLTKGNGTFELHSISGGIGGCPPMTVVLSKKGYQAKTLEVTSDSSTIIYLDKN